MTNEHLYPLLTDRIAAQRTLHRVRVAQVGTKFNSSVSVWGPTFQLFPVLTGNITSKTWILLTHLN